jgi:hypothetical protein
LHVRAVQRLRKALGTDCSTAEAAAALKPAILSFQHTMRRMRMAQARSVGIEGQQGVVLEYRAPAKAAKSRLKAQGSRVRTKGVA